MNKQNLIVFDTEVTGLDDNAELMSFAARIIDFEDIENDPALTEVLYTFPVKQDIKYHPHRFDYMKFQNDKLQDDTTNLMTFFERHKSDIFVGFNPEFDMKFLKRKCQIPYVKMIDILSLINYLVLKGKLKPYHRISEIAEQLDLDMFSYTGICNLQADVRLYTDIFLKLREML